MRVKEEVYNQVVENRVDIEILQTQMKEQRRINEDTSDVLEKGSAVINELDHEVRILKKLAAGLAFAAGGLFVLVLKTKADIREIRKAMNEG